MSHFSDIVIGVIVGMLIEGFLNLMAEDIPPPGNGFEQAKISLELQQELAQYPAGYKWSPKK